VKLPSLDWPRKLGVSNSCSYILWMQMGLLEDSEEEDSAGTIKQRSVSRYQSKVQGGRTDTGSSERSLQRSKRALSDGWRGVEAEVAVAGER